MSNEDKSYHCLFSLFLVPHNINKIIAYEQLNIVHDWIVNNNSSDIEPNKFIEEG